MGLLIVVVLLAIVGGFLGDLLEFAAWLIVVLAALGALLGFAVYRTFKKVQNRLS